LSRFSSSGTGFSGFPLLSNQSRKAAAFITKVVLVKYRFEILSVLLRSSALKTTD